MSFTEHKNKIVYGNIFVVKRIHNSKDSLEKSKKIIHKNSCDPLFHRVLFLCYMKLTSFFW